MEPAGVALCEDARVRVRKLDRVTSVVIACWRPRAALAVAAGRSHSRRATSGSSRADASGSLRAARRAGALQQSHPRVHASLRSREPHRQDLRRHEPEPSDPREHLTVSSRLARRLAPALDQDSTTAPFLHTPTAPVASVCGPTTTPPSSGYRSARCAPTWAPTVADHPHSPTSNLFMVGAGGQERLGAQTPHAHGLSGSPKRPAASRLEPGPETEATGAPNGTRLRRRVLTQPRRARVPA